MSIIFEALEKTKHGEEGTMSKGVADSRTPNVYTMRRLFFSPQGLLVIVAILIIVVCIAYYGYSYVASASYENKVHHSYEASAPPKGATGSSEKAPSRNRVSSIKIPAPPKKVNYPGRAGKGNGKEDKSHQQGTTKGMALPQKRHSLANKKNKTRNSRHRKEHLLQGEKLPMANRGTTKKGIKGYATSEVNPQRQSNPQAQTSKIFRLVTLIQGLMAQGDKGRVEQLLPVLERLKGADDPFVLKLRAFWEIKKGNLERATTLLRRVLARNPKDLEAGLNMAIIEIKRGKLKQARKRLRLLHNIYEDNSQISELLMKIKG